MNHYRIEDYFTPEAVELIHKSEIIGIDGVTEHAVVLLSCDLVPYAAMRDGDELIHAGALIDCLPSPAFALSDGLEPIPVIHHVNYPGELDLDICYAVVPR